MQTGTFAERFLEAIRVSGTCCVVGIDPAIERMPASFMEGRTIDSPSEGADVLREYSELVLDAIDGVIGIVKPQSAYFERYGAAGVAALEKVVAGAKARGLIVILDVKRGDIGPTSEAYAEAYLAPGGSFDVDAVTVNAYLGGDTLEPFVSACDRWKKGLFVLVKTSNPGSADFQDLATDQGSVCDAVARHIERLNEARCAPTAYGPVGAVVGATHPQHARRLRALMPHAILLVPGLGAQGGRADTLSAFAGPDGGGFVVSSSRAVMYPKSREASSLRDAIRAAASDFVHTVSGA